MTRTTYQANGGGLQGAALNNLKNSWYKVSGSFRVKPTARESTSSLMIRSSFSGPSRPAPMATLPAAPSTPPPPRPAQGPKMSPGQARASISGKTGVSKLSPMRTYGLSDSIDLTKTHLEDAATRATEAQQHTRRASVESLDKINLNGGFDELYRSASTRTAVQRPVVLQKTPPRQERRVKFCEQLEVLVATYSPHEYDRRRFHTSPGEHMDIASIREELDNFKEFDMPVHVDSQSNTLIYRYNYEKRMSYERQKAAMLAQQEIRRRVLDLRRMQLERLLDMQDDENAMAAISQASSLGQLMEKISLAAGPNSPIVHCLSADDLISTTTATGVV